MKKRICAILLCLIVAMTLFSFPVTVGAEEDVLPAPVESVQDTSSAPEESLVDDPAQTPETTVSVASDEESEGDDESHTLFTRTWDFVNSNKQEVLSICGTVSLLIMNLILKHSGSKTSQETKRSLEVIKGNVGMTLGGQDSVIEVTNKLIDGYNELSKRYEAMRDSYEKYGATEDERNRISGAVLATNIAILEILSSVYANNRQLPQGVKDLVMLKYANCLKSVEDDESLIAIVEAVRNNIGRSADASLPAETVETNPSDCASEHEEV